MKCQECGKRIFIWNLLSPMNPSCRVQVVDNDGKVTETFYACKKCGKAWRELLKFLNQYGGEYIEEMLKNEGMD